MPELPADKRNRFVESYGLREYDAQVLTATREISEYFEKAAKAAGDPRMAANWVTGDLLGALKGREITESPVSPEQLGELVAFIAKGEISGKMAKDIFAKMFETGESAADNYRSRRPAPDQRHRRAGENRGRSDRREPEAGGAVQIGEDRRASATWWDR